MSKTTRVVFLFNIQALRHSLVALANICLLQLSVHDAYFVRLHPTALHEHTAVLGASIASCASAWGAADRPDYCYHWSAFTIRSGKDSYTLTMTSSESEGQGQSRKRSRTSEGGGKEGKKARGRPRVDTQDATAADVSCLSSRVL